MAASLQRIVGYQPMENTLFPIEPFYPEGFSCTPNFISEEEEQHLLSVITDMQLQPFRFQGYEAKRRVASFGKDWSFDRRQLSDGKAIPNAFLGLVEKVAIHQGLPVAAFAELLVTHYPVGSLINWHRDAPPFALIAGISLAADCTFKLRPHAKEAQTRKNRLSLTIQRRSLYVMKGEARSEWQHSTAPVENERYSITLRTLR